MASKPVDVDVNVVQITLFFNKTRKLIIKADSKGRDPARVNNPVYTRTANINGKHDQDRMDLAIEILDKLRAAYSSKSNENISVTVDKHDEIIASSEGTGDAERSLPIPPKMSKKECEQLKDITEVWHNIPAGLRVSIKSMIKKIAKELE